MEYTVERESEMVSNLVMHDVAYHKNLNTTFTLTALPFGKQDNLLVIKETEKDAFLQ